LKGLYALLADLEIVATPYPLPEHLDVNLPAKDLPILAAAVAAKAKFLITGDKRHFGTPFGRKIHGIAILRPADYLRRAGARDD
jgi:predicted nucleic acid-binding protein